MKWFFLLQYIFQSFFKEITAHRSFITTQIELQCHHMTYIFSLQCIINKVTCDLFYTVWVAKLLLSNCLPFAPFCQQLLDEYPEWVSRSRQRSFIMPTFAYSTSCFTYCMRGISNHLTLLHLYSAKKVCTHVILHVLHTACCIFSVCINTSYS